MASFPNLDGVSNAAAALPIPVRRAFEPAHHARGSPTEASCGPYRSGSPSRAVEAVEKDPELAMARGGGPDPIGAVAKSRRDLLDEKPCVRPRQRSKQTSIGPFGKRR